MQTLSLLASVADQHDVREAALEAPVASEPQELDESMLALVSGGLKAPGNGW